MKTVIYVPDIECGSCVKVIGRKLKDNPSVESFTVKQDAVELTHLESLHPESIVKIIHQAGFRAGLNPFERKTFKERMRDFNQNQEKYEIEMKGVTYAIALFFILLIRKLDN